MSKRLSLILSLVLVFALLVGCTNNGGSNNQDANVPVNEDKGSSGSNNSQAKEPQGDPVPANLNFEGYPITKEKITLKMMGEKAPLHGPWEEMVFFKEMEKLTNIHFEFDTPARDIYEEKKNLAFAGGKIPDVFYAGHLSPLEEIRYGSQGILIPLENLIKDYAPNLNKYLDENPEVRKSITTPDGHIYSIPQIKGQSRAQVPKLWINGKWLEALGIGVDELPTTIEGLYDLLKRFRDEDPNKNGKQDEIPLTSFAVKDLRVNFLSAFGHVATSDDNLIQGLEVNGDKVDYVFTSDAFKEYLTFMHKLYDEKLLNNEIFSHTREQSNANSKNNLTGMTQAAAPIIFAAKPNEYAKYPLLPVLTSESSDEQLVHKHNYIVRGSFAITKNNEHPEATMRWLDYLWTEEGNLMAYQGIEGVHWKWLDAEKTAWAKISEIVPEGMNSEQFRGTIVPDVGEPSPIIKSQDFDAKYDDKGNQYLIEQTAKYIPYARLPFPLVYYTEEESKRLSSLMADIDTYIDQMEAKFIAGQESLSEWDKYVSTIKKMGIDEVVEINQVAYDRWKNAE